MEVNKTISVFAMLVITGSFKSKYIAAKFVIESPAVSVIFG